MSGKQRVVIVMCVIITKADQTRVCVCVTWGRAPSSSAPGSRLINNWHPSLVRLRWQCRTKRGATRLLIDLLKTGSKVTSTIPNFRSIFVLTMRLAAVKTSLSPNYLSVSRMWRMCGSNEGDSLIIILSLLQLADSHYCANFASPQMGKLVHNAIISP